MLAQAICRNQKNELVTMQVLLLSELAAQLKSFRKVATPPIYSFYVSVIDRR
jgi:hypothetical protein